MLKLRSIDLSDFAVFEGKQRIGRIRLATERMPCVWRWSVTIHLTGGLPMGSSRPGKPWRPGPRRSSLWRPTRQ